jgi:hypothetical protein
LTIDISHRIIIVNIQEVIMAHEEMVEGLMNQLVISDKHVIGDIMAHKGIWTKGTSASNNSDKALTVLTKFGKVEKVKSFYRLPSCKSEYKEHAQLLTKSLAEIIKLRFTAKILREPTLNEIGLRPDAIVLLENGNQGLCFILEVCNNETEEYLNQKINVWEHWEGAKEYLSNLFGTPIKAFNVLVAGGHSDNFKASIEEIKND